MEVSASFVACGDGDGKRKHVRRPPGRRVMARALPRRLLVGMLVMALATAACTGSDDPAATTSTAATPSTTSAPGVTTTEAAVVGAEPAMTMDEALGGTQAVQDFAIYLGLWTVTDDGVVSLYQDIVDHAAATTGATSDLQGGFTFTPTDALDAAVVDADGQLLPSLSADFGLMDADVGAIPGYPAGVVAPFEDTDRPGIAEALSPDDSVDGRLIVEILTADYEIARTHAGPGDRTVLGLGFLQGLTGDDLIGASYLFGQTLPGDPVVESGMMPHELFSYRWNQGLVRVFGDAVGRPVRGIASFDPAAPSAAAALVGTVSPTPVAVTAFSARAGVVAQGDAEGDEGDAEGDEGVDPVLTRLVKELLLATVFGQAIASADEEYWEELAKYIPEDQPNRDWLYAADDTEEVVEIVDMKNKRFVYVTRETASEIWTDQFDCPDLTLECMLDPSEIIGTGDMDRFFRDYALERALERCAAAAGELNRRNGAASSPGEANAEGDGSGADGTSADVSGEGTDEDTTSDDGDGGEDNADGPPPVSCAGSPNKFPKLPTGTIHGDVHVRTVDGDMYAHQAPGEFLAFDNGVATIQIRTEPWGTGLVAVTVATAVAARIGDHTLSLHDNGDTWVDGDLVEIPRGGSIMLGAGEVLRWEKGWVILWPDGTLAKVQLSTTQLLIVTPPAGPAQGLLGNADGDPSNDLVARDGELLEPDADKRRWEAFYEIYIDSWRITQDESLFHYAGGETTATFQREGPPSQRTSVDTLPADVFADADDICRSAGLTRDDVLEACILDVGLTGERGFAYDAFVVEASTPEPQASPPVVAGSADAVVTIDDVALGFGPEPPDQDPNAPQPKWQCQVDQGSFFANGSFTPTGGDTFEVRIEYLDAATSNTGDERFSVIVRRGTADYAWVLTYAEQFADAVPALSLDGTTLTAEGELYVNDPPTLGLGPINLLPEGSKLTPFSLTATCNP